MAKSKGSNIYWCGIPNNCWAYWL